VKVISTLVPSTTPILLGVIVPFPPSTDVITSNLSLTTILISISVIVL